MAAFSSIALGVGAAAGLGSAAIGASAAKKASKAQAASADAAAQTQRDIFQKQTELAEPFRQGGLTAQSRLLTLLGLQPPNAAAPLGAPAQNFALPGGGAFNIPGWGGNFTTSQPVNAFTDREGLQVDPNDPDFGRYARDFGMQDFEEDPGYAFRLSEGQKALDRSAAARGGLVSGGALKAATRFGQQMGSQEYQNAFNRYQVNRNNQINPLLSLMGASQLSTNTLINAAGDTGRNISDLQVGAGNARASGYIGSANALAGGLGGIANTFGQQAYLNQALGQNYFNPGGIATSGVGVGGGGLWGGRGGGISVNPSIYS